MLQIKCLASWYMNKTEHEHRTDIWTILLEYIFMEIFVSVYIFDGMCEIIGVEQTQNLFYIHHHHQLIHT